MSEEPDSFAAIIAELEARLAERRSNGQYPAELDRELEDHFRRFRVVTADAPFEAADDLGDRVREVREVAQFEPRPAESTSKVPGGATVHRLGGRLVARHVDELRRQLGDYSTAVVRALDEVHRFEERMAVVLERVDDLLEENRRLLEFRRSLELGIDQRLAELRQHDLPPMFNPWFSADRFEEAFRGSRELLHDRYGDLADRFLEHGPVLDLGCGRGEFLELLVQRSIEARGVELDDALVRECRAHGLAVDRADAIGALEAAPDASLGGISLIQVVEHLSPQQTSELAPLAARVLRPGGRIVIETINPLSLFVFSHALYLDPTHVRMVHPLYLEFLFREAGFREVALEWRSVPGDDIRLPAATAEGPQSEHLNAVIERLNEVLYGPQDYALIATR